MADPQTKASHYLLQILNIHQHAAFSIISRKFQYHVFLWKFMFASLEKKFYKFFTFRLNKGSCEPDKRNLG